MSKTEGKNPKPPNPKQKPHPNTREENGKKREGQEPAQSMKRERKEDMERIVGASYTGEANRKHTSTY